MPLYDLPTLLRPSSLNFRPHLSLSSLYTIVLFVSLLPQQACHSFSPLHILWILTSSLSFSLPFFFLPLLLLHVNKVIPDCSVVVFEI